MRECKNVDDDVTKIWNWISQYASYPAGVQKIIDNVEKNWSGVYKDIGVI